MGNTRLFGEVNAWNYRVAKLKMRIVPLDKKRVFPSDSVEVYFAQAGIIENIDFPGARSTVVVAVISVGSRPTIWTTTFRYDTSDLGRSGNSPYLLFSFARQGAYPSDEEVPKAAAMSGRFWSPFASPLAAASHPDQQL